MIMRAVGLVLNPLFCIFFLAFAVVPAHGEPKTILVFGDSLTWGWNPNSTPTTRYPKADRWPEIMGSALGERFDVVTEGLSGRTTVFEDQYHPGLLRGIDDFDAALVSHAPLDLVVIMLGTNDTKAYLGRSAAEIAQGMKLLASMGVNGLGIYAYAPPKVLIISPPPFGNAIDTDTNPLFKGAGKKLAALPALYAGIAGSIGAYFFDAASVVGPDEVGPDGVHLLVGGNRNLGHAVAAEVMRILEGG